MLNLQKQLPDKEHNLFNCMHYSCIIDSLVAAIQRPTDDPLATDKEKNPYLMTVQEFNSELKVRFG